MSQVLRAAEMICTEQQSGGTHRAAAAFALQGRNQHLEKQFLHCPFAFTLCFFFLVGTLGRIILGEGRMAFKGLLCACKERFFFKAGCGSFCSFSAFDPSSFFFFGGGSVMVSGTADGAAASAAGSSSETREKLCEKNLRGFCRGSSLRGQAQPAQLSSRTASPFCACGMALENFLNLAMKNPSILCVWG